MNTGTCPSLYTVLSNRTIFAVHAFRLAILTRLHQVNSLFVMALVKQRDVLRRLDAGETLEIPLDQVTIREA